MKHIYLVRHCRYENPKAIFPGRLPVVLSKKGRAQAEGMATFFADKNIEHIYSSAVLRCMQTSQIIGKDKIEISNDKRILEVLSANQGLWLDTEDGTTWKIGYGQLDTLGGEDEVAVQARMVDFFNDVTNSPYENFIICSHGDPLYFLYASLMHKTIKADWYKTADTAAGYQERGSVREIIWEVPNKYRFTDIVEF